MHDNVEFAVAPRTTEGGLRLQASPELDDIARARFTVPAKPKRLLTVIVELPVRFASIVRLADTAVTVKSWTVYDTVTLCRSDPLLAVTVTEYVPEEPLQESVEEPELPREIVFWLKAQLRPLVEETAVKATVPVNPFRLATVMVELPRAPASTVTDVGLADTVKSWTV